MVREDWKNPKRPSATKKESYKYFFMGFLIIGSLSGKLFYGISHFEEDVEQLAAQAIAETNRQLQEGIPAVPEVGGIVIETDTGTSEASETIEKNGELILKPENALHYIPAFTKQGDSWTLEEEAFVSVPVVELNSFLTKSLKKLKKDTSVVVTELESQESQDEGTNKMTLREYEIDYAKMVLNRKDQVKIGDSNIAVTKEVFVNQEGYFSSEPQNVDGSGNPRTTSVSFGDDKMNKGNFLTKTSLFDTEKSPYHMVEQFATVPKSHAEYTIIGNDEYYVLYSVDNQELTDTIQNKVEIIWFDRQEKRPTRAMVYSAVKKDETYTYTVNEKVYGSWNTEIDTENQLLSN